MHNPGHGLTQKHGSAITDAPAVATGAGSQFTPVKCAVKIQGLKPIPFSAQFLAIQDASPLQRMRVKCQPLSHEDVA